MNLHCMHTGPLKVNTFLISVSDSEAIVVDPADCRFSRDEGSVVSFLSARNIKPVAVILTHGHFDHVSGLPVIKKSFPDIQIAIHREDSAMLGEHSEDLQGNALSQVGFDRFLPFVSNLPDATAFLDDGKTLAQILDCEKFSDEAQKSLAQWEVMHTPGHTEGSCCLYNEDERTLISGDTLFFQSWGRTDLIGGNERKIHASLAKINDWCEEDTKVYPGHDYYGFKLSENF
ncbi:MBL fold metallo-hydrolase [uncultured Treponema sp.]|uniref:MBL fold metallo-hydrolase n=1 Tax=uncultured Treponema sp. TaxID=162155 RepID=UPI0025ED1A17|nr:MBL fold metallo-hydrolase [uncultured Treponema sp.]